jgi:gliding motility-associated lipoprotein GldD
VYENNAPFSIEIPTYSKIVPDTSELAEANWYNLELPSMKGKIHLSYKPINNNLSKYIEDSRTLAYKHIIKADDIIEHPFRNKDNNVIAVLYEIKGNAASPFQFFATDSAKHFLRGSLYFNVYPNKDSLAPVFEFLQADIKHLIETLKWKQ